MLDNEELQDLLFIEERMKKDLQTQKKINLSDNDKPIFFGNSSLGRQSAMNSPTWKKILAKNGSLEGTKFHMHKVEDHKATTEPIWQITTDENGHKGVMQIGSKPIENIKQIDTLTKNMLPTGQEQNKLIIPQNNTLVDYDAEWIQINIWRGFALLEKLIPDFNTLDLNARIAAFNEERNKQAVLVEAAA